jgi:hypothetical protein
MRVARVCKSCGGGFMGKDWEHVCRSCELLECFSTGGGSMTESAGLKDGRSSKELSHGIYTSPLETEGSDLSEGKSVRGFIGSGQRGGELVMAPGDEDYPSSRTARTANLPSKGTPDTTVASAVEVGDQVDTDAPSERMGE